MTSTSEQTSKNSTENSDTTSQETNLVRDNSTGRFVKGISGNPNGRPKGSKNKVTMLKLMVEEAVREDNADKMLQVANLIVNQALEGDKDSQKLVWASIMSKSAADNSVAGKESVQINISTTDSASKKAEIIENEADEAEYTEGDQDG
jgi:hypothetical protein